MGVVKTELYRGGKERGEHVGRRLHRDSVLV